MRKTGWWPNHISLSSTEIPNSSQNWRWMDSSFRFPFISISPSFQLPLFHPLYLLHPLFVTGWGSSPLLGRLSLNDSCRFCWVQSSRTWAAWRCPPRPSLWRQAGPEPSVCPPSLARPLWRTWTALWLYWKIESTMRIALKPWWWSVKVNGCYSLHPLFLQTQQAVRHDVHRQVLIRQSHLKLVQ